MSGRAPGPGWLEGTFEVSEICDQEFDPVWWRSDGLFFQDAVEIELGLGDQNRDVVASRVACAKKIEGLAAGGSDDALERLLFGSRWK